MNVTETPEATAHVEPLELKQVLASRSFAKSPRLCSLLRFIVTETLNGRHENLTEQQIGIRVFGRAPGYNSSDDTIVRVTVRQLRQRLHLYYTSEGSANQSRIDIPKGGYVALLGSTVVHTDPEPSAASPEALALLTQTSVPPQAFTQGSAEPSAWKRVRLWLPWLLLTVLACVVLALGYVCLQQSRALSRRSPQVGPLPLWQAIFTAERKTIVVPGDAALDNYVAWEQRQVSLEQFATQEYLHHAQATLSPTGKDVPLSVRSVTPMADLALVSTLTGAFDHLQNALPEVGSRMELRYARDLAVADTHDNNLILIGSDTFNPWVTLYQPQMDFTHHYDVAADKYILQNKAPRPGEQVEYVYARFEPSQKAYTHIALLNNLQGGGRVLLVEGTTMGSTYGAINFLTHEALYAPVIRAATDASGRLHDFEVLLSGNFLHGGVGNSQVVAVHVH